MSSALALIWPQPLDPLHSMVLSALVAAIPIAVLLVLMGGLRKSGLYSSTCGLLTAAALAVLVWHMPATLALSSMIFGALYALWPIMWIVFGGMWLYNVASDTGKFEILRRWMLQRASGDPCIQAILVAFCFGAILEGSAGFGTPVAITAFLLVGLGFSAYRAVLVALLANTTPVAFGALGLPIVALAGVTGLDVAKLSGMVGRQLPFLSFILPSYLLWVIDGRKGLRRSWPAALVGGGSFALAQFLVSNFWGPYATDILAALASILALITFLRFWSPAGAVLDERTRTDSGRLSSGAVMAAWLPWAVLSLVMVLWSHLQLFGKGQINVQVPQLHNGVFITLYQKPYAALYAFQPLAAGTAVLAATLLTAVFFRVQPRVLLESGRKTLQQLRLPGLTVILIIGLAYLYNYSGMVYTLGAALARLGAAFPLVSSFLGWLACFLSGSDTSSNLLFGNLQVAVAHQLHLNPVLLAATNSSGGVTGKMISPQNIAIGVTTIGLIGQEGKVLRSTFWHSILFAALISILAYLQAYFVPSMVP